MRRTYVEFKRARENATAAANLEQRAKAGLKHVAEILGIPQVSRPTQSISLLYPCAPSLFYKLWMSRGYVRTKPDCFVVHVQTDLTAPVHEIVHQIEAVLDILQVCAQLGLCLNQFCEFHCLDYCDADPLVLIGCGTVQEETERHHQQKLADPHGNKTLKQLSVRAYRSGQYM